MTQLFADNIVSGGTKIKLLPGTSTISSRDLILKPGAQFANSGTVVLKKDLHNECSGPTLTGPGMLKLDGDISQIISGSNCIQNLIVNNSTGINLSGLTRVEGTLYLQEGILNLGDYNLVLGPFATISGQPSIARMIDATGNGQVQKQFPIDFTGSFTFPVGDNVETPNYTPITLHYISGSYTSDNFVGVTLKNFKYPDTTITDNYLRRFWNISTNGSSSILYDVIFQYVPEDIVGTESMVNCYKIIEGQSIPYGPADTVNHTLKSDSTIVFGSFTGGGGGSLPPATINGPGSVCFNVPGYTYITETGKSNYLWNVSSGGIVTAGGTANDNFVVVTWVSLAPQTISVNYFGSPNPAAMNISVNPRPVPVINGPANVCENSSEIVYLTETGMTNYQWAISQGGSIIAGQGTSQITVAWYSAGEQTVSVNYINQFGCSAVNNTVYPVLVKANVLVEVSIIASNNNICAGTEVTFTAVPVNGGVNPSYQWYRNSIPVGNNSPNYLCIPDNGDIIKVVLTSSETCQSGPASSTPMTVIVNPLPVPTITGMTEVCAEVQDVIYKTEEDMSGYSWAVSSGGLITSGEGTSTIHIIWNTAGDHEVSVNYVTSNNCTAPAPSTQIVHVNALPTPTVAGQIHVCSGVTGELYSTESGMTNYSWTISPGGTITSGSDTHEIAVTWNTPGTNFVKVNYTNQVGCTAASPSSKTVFVHVLPTPTISGSDGPCLNTVETYVTESGMYDYNWVISPGGVILSGSEGNHSITVMWTQPGPQYVAVNYYNGYGCTAENSTYKDIFVTGPTINGPTEVCKLAVVRYETQEGMGSSYVWAFFGGIKQEGGGPQDNYIVIKWIAVGNRYVKVTYTNDGCTATTTLPVVVNFTSPSLVGPSSSCLNSVSSFSTESNMLNYNWTVAAGGEIIGSTNSSVVTILWHTTGSQWVSVDYDSPYGCTISPTTINVYVYDLPLPKIQGPSGPMCLSDDVITYTTEPGQTAYNWSCSSGGTIVSGGGAANDYVNIKWSQSGQQFVKVNYTTKHYCTAPQPTQLNVTINPLPEPSIGGPELILVNTTGLYESETGKLNYLWEVISGGNIVNGGGSADAFVFIEWFEVGIHPVSLTYTDDNGCSGMTTIYVEVAANIKSGESDPITSEQENNNASFTVYPVPNNGRFTVSIESPSLDNYTIQIFNGLGAEIYKQQNIQAEGTYKQFIDLSNVAEGVYTVIVRSSDTQASKRIHIRK